MGFTKNTVQDITLHSRGGKCTTQFGDMPVGRVFAEAYISNTYARHRFPAASLSAFLPSPAAGFPSVFHNQLINIIMLKKTISYETPDMMVFEMHTEGVMCGSIVEDYGVAGEAGKPGIIIGGSGEEMEIY